MGDIERGRSIQSRPPRGPDRSDHSRPDHRSFRGKPGSQRLRPVSFAPLGRPETESLSWLVGIKAIERTPDVRAARPMAARPAQRSEAPPLPAVADRFLAWCRETAADFQLEPGIQELLGQRAHRQALTKRHGEWRQMATEDPAVCRIWGFKDDPKKSDEDSLRLEAELVPVWRPGYDMRRSKG